jgi:molybdopterin biosynthesis enzyme
MNALMSATDAWTRLLDRLTPVDPRVVSLQEARGAIAAQDVVAQAPVPARAIALRDGYALCADEIAGASSYAPVLLAQKPAFVAAGDVLPEGCDCIIEASGLDLDGPLPQAMVESFPGENVRRAGEDFAQGAVMLREGERVSAVACAALASAGVSTLSVRAPVIFVKGEEGAAKNMLASLLAAEGARSEGGPDLLVCIGAPQGDVIAQNLALETGRKIVLAMQNGVPAIFLASRIDEALVAFTAFILPAFDHLAGHKRTFLRLPLAQKIASRVGLCEIALLAAEEGHFHVLAVGDLPLQSLARATHVALIAADSEGHAAGEMISAIPVRA